MVVDKRPMVMVVLVEEDEVQSAESLLISRSHIPVVTKKRKEKRKKLKQ